MSAVCQQGEISRWRKQRKSFSQQLVYGLLQLRQIALNNFPHQLKVHALVIVNDVVAQAVHLPPGDLRVGGGKAVIGHFAQFPQLTQVINTQASTSLLSAEKVA